MEINNNFTLSQQTSQPQTKKRDSADFQKALADFYIIHEQSQITGVSTYKYNKAIEKLGFQEGEDLRAIQLLKQYGYDISAPSIEAITKYGDIIQEVGNHTYMRDNSKEAKNLQVNSSDSKTDTQKPYNYFDAAEKISKVIPKEDQKKTLTQVVKPMQNESLSLSEKTAASQNDLLTLVEQFLQKSLSGQQPQNSLLSTLIQS